MTHRVDPGFDGKRFTGVSLALLVIRDFHGFFEQNIPVPLPSVRPFGLLRNSTPFCDAKERFSARDEPRLLRVR